MPASGSCATILKSFTTVHPALLRQLLVVPAGVAPPGRQLLRLNARILDHLRPFDQLNLDKLAQLFRRAGRGLESDCAEARPDVRVVDDLAQLGIEPSDDLTRCAGWREHGRP